MLQALKMNTLINKCVFIYTNSTDIMYKSKAVAQVASVLQWWVFACAEQTEDRDTTTRNSWSEAATGLSLNAAEASDCDAPTCRGLLHVTLYTSLLMFSNHTL